MNKFKKYKYLRGPSFFKYILILSLDLQQTSLYIYIYIYTYIISSQRPKTVAVDYSFIEYMKKII